MNKEALINLWSNKEVKIAVGVFLGLFAFQLFQWTFVDYLTVFIFPLVKLVVVVVFFIYFIRSIFKAFGKNRSNITSIVLAINLASVLMFLFFPFTELSLQSDFKLHHAARQEVVEKIKSSELSNNMDHNKSMIHLSLSDGRLSKGGNDIRFEGEEGNLSVMFYTFRGVIDNFAAIIYKENNIPPTNEDFNCGYLIDSLKFQDNWYWMSCT